MKRIDDYINSIYKNFKDNNREIEELKLDMKNHLIEVIEELKGEGYSEEKSIDIAIDRFGDSGLIEGELSGIIKEKKNNIVKLLLLSLIFFPIVYIIAYLLGDGFYEVNGAALIIILVPVYTIYEVIFIYNIKKKKIQVDNVNEVIKYLFIIYLIILGAKILFPMGIYPNLSKSIVPSIILIPFSGIEYIKQYPLSFLKYRSILIMYFVPLGFLAPLLSHKFKSVKSIFLLTLIVFGVKFLITLIVGLLGMGRFTNIYLDNLLLYLMGALIGYAIYTFKERDSKLKIENEYR